MFDVKKNKQKQTFFNVRRSSQRRICRYFHKAGDRQDISSRGVAPTAPLRQFWRMGVSVDITESLPAYDTNGSAYDVMALPMTQMVLRMTCVALHMTQMALQMT